MSWPWTWFGSSDPTSDLDIDPSLKDFLKKSAPEHYNPVQSTHPVEDRSYRAQVGLVPDEKKDARNDFQKLREATRTPQGQTNEDEQRPLPKESLFQDGRYQHLWRHYRSEKELNESSKSDQDKLLDVVEAYKDRQTNLKKAAMENCADFQMAIHECFRSGGLSARMTMCRAENRALQRCITMQSKFLRALGYMSVWERTEEESEKVQMHADTLYQRMIEHERIREEAKEQGREPPELGSIFGPKEQREREMVNVPGRKGSIYYDGIQDPELKEEVKKRFFKGMDDKSDTFELAKEKWDADIALVETMQRRIGEQYYRDYEERTKRYHEGKERVGDKVKRWFDMRQYPAENPYKEQQVHEFMQPRDRTRQEDQNKQQEG